MITLITMGCCWSWHMRVVSETIFELGDIGTSTLIHSFVRKADGTLGVRKTIRVQVWVCKKCKKQRQVYLKHKPLKGWKLKYDGKYTTINGQLYKNNVLYDGKCTILDHVPDGL